VSFDLWEHSEEIICDRHEVLGELPIANTPFGTWRRAVSHNFTNEFSGFIATAYYWFCSQCGSHMSLRNVCEFVFGYQPTIL